MAHPPRGKRPFAAPPLFVQSEFAPPPKICTRFFEEFLGSYDQKLLAEATSGTDYLAEVTADASAPRLCCSKPYHRQWLAKKPPPRSPPPPRPWPLPKLHRWVVASP